MAKKRIASRKRTAKKTSASAKRRTAGRKAPRRAARRKAPKRAAGDVRERVRSLTVRTLRDRDLKLRDIPSLAQNFVEGIATGLNNAVPASSRNVLRQVVDGLTDAAEASVQSAKSAVTATGRRGSEMTRQAARTARELRGLEGDFIAALSRAGRKLNGAARDEMQIIVRRAREAGTRIKPAAERVLKATDGHLLELGRETAGASGRAARSALQNVLAGAGGLLQGLSDVIEGKPARSRPRRAQKSSKPSRSA